MRRPLVQKRFRRRFSLERCEPRQMLSVVPVSAYQAELVGQFMGLTSTSITSNGNVNAGVWIVDFDNRVLALTTDNAFGGSTNAYEGPILFSAEFSGSAQLWNYELRTIIQPPTLDPIAPHSPVSAPTPNPPPGQISPPERISTGAPIASALAVSAPISGFASATLATPKLNTTDDGASPRWLSATFSPLEQHRLDAAVGDIHYERMVANRDPRSRLALEATRVSCQTFCVVSQANAPTLVDGIDVPRAVRNPQDGVDPTHLPSQTLNKSRADATNVPAVHDAAILEWEGPQSTRLSSPIPSTTNGNSSAAGTVSPVHNVEELLDAEFGPVQVAAWFLDHKKHLFGAVLGLIAMESLWAFKKTDAAERQIPGREASLLRKPRKSVPLSDEA